MDMYDHSRQVMRADGNNVQWVVGYPSRRQAIADIMAGVAYLLENALEGIIGCFSLIPGVEPTYGYIEYGRWIDTVTPYATMHRLAAMPDTQGVAHKALAYAKETYPHLRIDTHDLNRAMRHIAEKEGFVYCGTVYMSDGSPRRAYEWWRFDVVPSGLREYVEKEILPRHESYDAAHGPQHVRRVMARAMMMMPAATTYAAAALHDIGICCGREEHHLASGRMIRDDERLREWFGEEVVELIAQAAEDHRASSSRRPRSELGCVIAEADRDIEPETIVRRTVEYGLAHYPELDREGHWQRTLEHLHEKYAEGGYLRLWMDDSPNAAPLAELRALIADEERLHKLVVSILNN
jgi:uncharacterized protein